MKNTSGILFVATLLATSFISAAEVRLNGASTTVNAVINPYKSAVESSTGITLAAQGTNTGVGLGALTSGKCDASLTSEPLDVSMIAAKFAGLQLNAADFQIHPVKIDYVVFVAHPSNSVNNLSADQLRDILGGKITNWKDVGGADLPIVVFTDSVGAGTRTLVQARALGGADYGANTRPLENIRVVAGAIAELKGGFGAVGSSFADPKLVKVIETEKITRPLGFITKGAPSEDVQKVINAFKAEVAKAGK